jgi:hypothetical protein
VVPRIANVMSLVSVLQFNFLGISQYYYTKVPQIEVFGLTLTITSRNRNVHKMLVCNCLADSSS